jgi:hypothetical protein
MPRYSFNIRFDGSIIEDEEGLELAGLDAAREEAVLSARSLVLEELRSGNPIGPTDGIAVSDETGHVLLTILFTEVALNVGNGSNQ